MRPSAPQSQSPERSVAEKLDAVEVRNVKAELRPGSELEPLRGGEIVEAAIGAMPIKVAADHMGISGSLLSRGLQNKDHVSFQRLLRLPAAIKEQIALQMLEDCGNEIERLVRVRKAS